MTKRYALVLLWAVFAGAAVGVGFAAAGLVSAPFEQQAGGPGVPVDAPRGSAAAVAATGTAAPSGSPTTSAGRRGHQGTGSSGRATGHSLSATPGPSSSSASGSSSGSGRGGSHGATSSSAPTSQPRGITTRGGWVQGRCSGGLVTLSVSPAVGWYLDQRSSGANSTGEVRFVQTGDTGEVQVSATCSAGTPRFSVTEDEQGGGGGGDDGGGGGPGSGGGGGPGSGEG